MAEFEFHREDDGSLPIETAVFQALGAASMCWDRPAAAGVFHEDEATMIGNALLEEIRKGSGPMLGRATTEQLLNELRARIEVDYHNGGGGLQYTTVSGRPSGLSMPVALGYPDDSQSIGDHHG